MNLTPKEASQKIVAILTAQSQIMQNDLERVKHLIAQECGQQPPTSQILSVYQELIREQKISPRPELAKLLVTRRIRSLSGVSVVSVLTKPYPCPGECLYCPRQAGVPVSYLDNEPAVMRAIRCQYDPYRQVASRIQALTETGHPTDKIKLIVLGGTWSYLPLDYQEQFIQKCFEAANQEPSSDLNQTHQINARTEHRIIGLSLETRPDYINPEEVQRMRRLGTTKVEIGAQCLDDRILSINRRGHGVLAIAQATKWLKEAGFKVGYHLMLNLPGANIAQEKAAAQLLFSDQRFRPDFLKIYPTAILPEAPLYQWWREGRYHPYSDRQLIDLLKFVKRQVPTYCRIQRVIRDIPSINVPVGPVKTTNLREIVLREMKEENQPCQCIRCREIRDYQLTEPLIMFREDYMSAQGKEIFLSFEDQKRKHLAALLRLRIPASFLSGQKHFWPILEKAAIIREVHAYGQQLPLGQKDDSATQHHGLGQKLIAQAEKIVRHEFGGQIEKMAITAGVGTREYYQRLGYQLEDYYMIKPLT